MDRSIPRTLVLACSACSLVSLSSAAVSPQGAPGREIQPQVAMGMTVAWPTAYLERIPNSKTFLKVRGPGTVVGGGMPPSPATEAGYRIADLFPNNPGIKLDAMSTGNGVIPNADIVSGNIDPDNNNWLTVTASVEKNSQGPANSLVNDSFLAGEEANTLFGHYLDESTFIDPFLVGATIVEAPASRIGCGPNSVQDLVGLDFALGVLTYNTQVDSAVSFPNGLGEFYFSVTQQWAFGPGGTNFAKDAANNTVDAHPGAIYKTFWTQGIGWSMPEVWIHQDRLAPPESQLDIDALEIDLSSNRILFSATTESNLQSQIMLAERGGPLPVPAKDGHGVKVADRLRVDDGVGTDVDALCGTDPEGAALVNSIGFQGGPHTQVSALGQMASGESGGLSIARVGTGPGVDTPGYFMVLSGWGAHPPADSLCVMDLQTGTITAGPNPVVVEGTITTFSDVPFDRGSTDILKEIFIPYPAPTNSNYPQNNLPQPFHEFQFSVVTLPLTWPLTVRRTAKTFVLDD